MTATPAVDGARRANAGDTPALIRLLETGFGRESRDQGQIRNQFLLDALDRGEVARFVVWPRRHPVAVLYSSDSGTIVPAGEPAAGVALAEAADAASWRVLIGDEPIGLAVSAHAVRGMFRRTPRVRQQRLMAFDPERPPLPPPPELRRARSHEVDRLTDFACALHVEDQMGPPISRSGRASVRARMRDSVLDDATWVVEVDGQPVAKVDAALCSTRRGAQLAGVYVDPAWRGRGLAGAAVATIARRLVSEGIPAVTLHVRADNVPALRAYERAGFTDLCPWVLALR